jgi:hypothetical protein
MESATSKGYFIYGFFNRKRSVFQGVNVLIGSKR